MGNKDDRMRREEIEGKPPGGQVVGEAINVTTDLGSIIISTGKKTEEVSVTIPVSANHNQVAALVSVLNEGPNYSARISRRGKDPHNPSTEIRAKGRPFDEVIGLVKGQFSSPDR